MKSLGQLPADKPNWALGRLMPWQVPEALELAKKLKQNAVMEQNPFKKLDEYNEACRSVVASCMYTLIAFLSLLPTACPPHPFILSSHS